jgi:hypothetical protein
MLTAQRCNFGLNALLGRPRAQHLHQLIPELRKLPSPINRLRNAKRLNGAALKLIASVPREKVHMQVRQSIAMNLVVELDGARYGRQDGRDTMRVLKESCRLSCREIVQLNRMGARN